MDWMRGCGGLSMMCGDASDGRRIRVSRESAGLRRMVNRLPERGCDGSRARMAEGAEERGEGR